ncbi:MAG: FecR domain-containing protein, partial [Anaerolineae bacterium]|nr:FecR domain-containing protein [Anaerolineae bacterium]
PVEETPAWVRRRGLLANPQRLAWTVLILAFTTFCILAVSIPLSIRWFVLYSTKAETVHVEVLANTGTILVTAPGAREPAAVESARVVSEGDIIRSADARAIVTVEEPDEPEGILTTIQLYSQTELRVIAARKPRFRRSREPYRIEMELRHGRVRVLNLKPLNRALSVRVSTPHGVVELTDGSFSIEIGEEESQVTVRSGQARVHSGGVIVTVRPGERTVWQKSMPPSEPLPAAQNLVVNGNFEKGLEGTWRTGTYQHASNVTPASIEVVDVGGRRAVYFSRRAEEGIHTEAWIEQELNKDVLDYEYLSIRLDVRLLYQSLPGGGYLSSEFPLMVRINYTDVYGKQLEWVHGFYYRDPDPNSNWPIINGEKIPAYVWYPYESPNLIDLLSKTRPARLNSIRIYASGWNYQSMVSEVGVIAR